MSGNLDEYMKVFHDCARTIIGDDDLLRACEEDTARAKEVTEARAEEEQALADRAAELQSTTGWDQAMKVVENWPPHE